MMHIKILLILITSSFSLANHHYPKNEKQSLSGASVLRVFKKIDKKHTLVGSINYRNDNSRNVTDTIISYRRKVDKTTSYGIEANGSTGQRHDDDWTMDYATSDWFWKDSASRFEFGTSLFLKYKKGLYFLPLTNWVGEVNIKTHNNWSENLLTLKPSATLTYIHFENGEPIYNLYTKVEYYLPLNYSDEDIYKKWLYVGTLFHLSKKYKPIIFFASKTETWTRSKKFIDKHPNETYRSESTINYLGLGLNIYY